MAFRNFRKDDYAAGLSFRAGLPWSSQLEIAIPFATQRVETVLGGLSRRSTDSGVADLQATVAHQFLNERDAHVALLGSLSWAHSSNSAALRPLAAGISDITSIASVGSGHDALVGRLAASKRLDPLVFVASVSHAWNRASDIDAASVRVAPANGASVRAILAASPDVSLRTGLSFTRTGNTRVNGLVLEGTRTTASVLELGTSVILGRNMLLDVSLGIGLTSESPDFLLGVSLPIRF